MGLFSCCCLCSVYTASKGHHHHHHHHHHSNYYVMLINIIVWGCAPSSGSTSLRPCNTFTLRMSMQKTFTTCCCQVEGTFWALLLSITSFHIRHNCSSPSLGKESATVRLCLSETLLQATMPIFNSPGWCLPSERRLHIEHANSAQIRLKEKRGLIWMILRASF